MPAHRSHGRVYVEPPRHDELPAGAPPTQETAGDDPRESGKLMAGASRVPRLGGLATRGHTSLSHRISDQAFDDAGRKRVRALRKALTSEYRATVGRGYCGVGASLLCKVVATAAEFHEQALRKGDPEEARKQADVIKTTMAYAREECAKVGEARDRPRADGTLGNGRPRPGWRIVDEPKGAGP